MRRHLNNFAVLHFLVLALLIRYSRRRPRLLLLSRRFFLFSKQALDSNISSTSVFKEKQAEGFEQAVKVKAQQLTKNYRVVRSVPYYMLNPKKR